MPLADLLNADGTLDLSRGSSGALDPAGWRMEYGPGGALIFEPAGEPAAPLSPGKEWHALGSGMNDAVMAIAVAGVDIYAGGYFTDTGGIASADYIARWDGSAWHALGSGLNDTVFAIAVAGSGVYVGGRFTDTGGDASADRIARWGPPVYRVYLPLVVRNG